MSSPSSRLSVRIQHHPRRAHLLPDLLARLHPLPSEVIEHHSDPPSPWGGYRLCLDSPPDSSHLVVVQDDAMPVPGFAGAVEQIAVAHPEVPVCLFLSKLPRDTKPRPAAAMKMGRRYVALSWRSFLPVVAVMWPRAKALEFAEWATNNPHLPGQREPRSDDAMAGRWKMLTRQTVYACVPSIVDHPDQEPSLIRTQQMRANPRTAAFLAENALDFDWSTP